MIFCNALTRVNLKGYTVLGYAAMSTRKLNTFFALSSWDNLKYCSLQNPQRTNKIQKTYRWGLDHCSNVETLRLENSEDSSIRIDFLRPLGPSNPGINTDPAYLGSIWKVLETLKVISLWKVFVFFSSSLKWKIFRHYLLSEIFTEIPDSF